jgi:hypothetical protein
MPVGRDDRASRHGALRLHAVGEAIHRGVANKAAPGGHDGDVVGRVGGVAHADELERRDVAGLRVVGPGSRRAGVKSISTRLGVVMVAPRKVVVPVAVGEQKVAGLGILPVGG